MPPLVLSWTADRPERMFAMTHANACLSVQALAATGVAQRLRDISALSPCKDIRPDAERLLSCIGG